MTEAILQFLGCAAVIVAAGVVLTRAADEIAELTGLGRLLVGSLLLAGATSLPELMTDISAVQLATPAPDLAVGDLMGSSLSNLLILAVLDLACGGRLLMRINLHHGLSASFSIVMILLVVVGLQLSSSTTWVGVDLMGSAILVVYVLGLRVVFRDQQFVEAVALPQAAPAVAAGGAALPPPASPEAIATALEQTTAIPPAEPPHPPGKFALIKAVAAYVGGAGVIVWVAPHFAHAADQLAELSGLGGSFVGSTLVAFSTSLPEIVASVVAIRIGQPDLAIGNVFGSNSFNMVILPVVDWFYDGAIFQAAAPVHTLSGTAACLVTALALMAKLNRTERRLSLLEPSSSVMIAVIFGTLVLVYFRS